MIIDGHKSIEELQELRYNYHKDIAQLEEMHSRLRERYSKLSEINDNRHIYELLELTVDSLRSVEEALHKLHEADAGAEKLIELYQAYLKVEL